LMAPGDGGEIIESLRLALALDVPSAIRYPRDSVPAPLINGKTRPFELGKSLTLRAGRDATILAYGSSCIHALEAARYLVEDGIETCVVNARFAKPVDEEMVRAAFERGGPVITAEEHSPYGGIGTAILETAQKLQLPTQRLTRLALPGDEFVAHGSRAHQLAQCGLDAKGMISGL